MNNQLDLMVLKQVEKKYRLLELLVILLLLVFKLLALVLVL